MEEVAKELVKNVNDENLVGVKANFEQLIADRIYDKLEQKKAEMAKKMFNKEKENSEKEEKTDSEEQKSASAEQPAETSSSDQESTENAAEVATAE